MPIMILKPIDTMINTNISEIMFIHILAIYPAI